MQTFEVAGPIAAVVDIPAGLVQVIAADRHDVTVEVRPADAGKARDVKAAEQTVVEFGDAVVTVTGDKGKHILGPSGFVEVTVQVPVGSRVQAKTASGDVRSVGRLGEVVVAVAQGVVDVNEAAGLRVEVQAGDVVVGKVTGSARVSVDKGDVRVAEAGRGSLVVSTQAGNVEIVAAAWVSASLDAEAKAGRVHNALKNSGGVDLEIRATTQYGDIAARSLQE